MIYEIEHKLTSDERETLLFLTGGLKCFKISELDSSSAENIRRYFDFKDKELLKVIIFKDKVVTKVKS